MGNKFMQLFVTLLAHHASADVSIATTTWHTFNLIGEVIKAEFEARGVEVENSPKTYPSSYAALQGLFAGEVDIVPEAWMDIREANGFYIFNGSACGDAALCEEKATQCVLPGATDCAACEQACAGSSNCTIYGCSDREIDNARRCQLWSSSYFSKSSEFLSETFFGAREGSTCGVKAGLLDIQPFATGRQSIYVPNYVGLHDWTTQEELVSSKVKFLVGPPVSWKVTYAISVAIAAKYRLTLITPTSSNDHLNTIFDYMKLDEPFAFFFWEPHAVPATYDVTAVTLPLNTEVSPPAPYFPVTQRLLIVWRVSNRNAARHIKKIVSVRNLSHEAFIHMLDIVSDQVSLTLPSTNPAYRKAIANAAYAHLCESTDQIRFCIPISTWPMEKVSTFPESALVWTHECAGFVKCIGDNGEKLFRPEEGYSVEHLHKVMHLVGYKRQEYDVRCYHEAGGIGGMVAKTGLEMATLAHSCITIKAEQHMLASFSTSFYHTWMNILVKRPRQKETVIYQLSALMVPFDENTWITVTLIFFAAGIWLMLAESTRMRDRRHFCRICAFFVALFTKPKLPDKPSSTLSIERQFESPRASSVRSNDSSWGRLAVRMTIVDSIDETIHRVQTAHWIHLKSGSARLLMIFNITLLLVIAEFYTANVAAVLVVDTLRPEIRGIQDLRGKTVAAVKGRSSLWWLHDNEPKVKIKLCEMEQECVDFVLQGEVEAFVHDEPSLQYMAAKNCDLRLVNGPRFFIHDYGIVFPRGSPLRDSISHAVTFLREESTYQELQRKYFRARDCKGEETKSKITPLNLVGLLLPLVAMYAVVWTISQLYAKIRQGALEAATRQNTPQGNREMQLQQLQQMQQGNGNGRDMGIMMRPQIVVRGPPSYTSQSMRGPPSYTSQSMRGPPSYASQSISSSERARQMTDYDLGSSKASQFDSPEKTAYSDLGSQASNGLVPWSQWYRYGDKDDESAILASATPTHGKQPDDLLRFDVRGATADWMENLEPDVGSLNVHSETSGRLPARIDEP